MKTFETFLKTRRKISVKDFNEASQSDIEENGVSFVYAYQNFTYINIYDNKSIGFPSQTKKYGLIICNEYYESDNLEELEIKLYNDWFIDNLEGSEEWMYKVGYHTPQQTPLYYKMFQDMALNVEDISYKNDVVDTLRLSYKRVAICDVLLPNSATQDLNNEKHDTFQLEYLDMNGERIFENNSIPTLPHIFETIDDLQNALVEWFHQMARDYMDDVVDECKLDNPQPMSLDEFIIEHKGTMDGKFGRLYNIGNNIVSLHNNFKPLEDWYKFGCEPKNMFEDGIEAKSETREYLISFLQNSNKVKEMWLDSEIKNIPNLSTKALQECYSELQDVYHCFDIESSLTSSFRKLLDNYDDNMINKEHFIQRMEEEIKTHN